MEQAVKLGTAGNAPASNRWEADKSALEDPALFPATTVFAANDVRDLLAGFSLWDVWPVQLDDGSVAPVKDGSLWVILSAPRTQNPDDRHGAARMRMLYLDGETWHDCGNLLPDGFSPGSREWSGSTRLDPESGKVTVWFTAAGRRGGEQHDFEQRLFHVRGQLDLSGTIPSVRDWSGLTETVSNDGAFYADLSVNKGVPGMIKGFRDPYWFRDPADGKGYILFTGSKSADASQSTFDGVVGIAAANDADGTTPFTLMAPLIDADGQANELERPHIFVHEGLYYLFWSTQRHMFAPGGLEGPTGLYGMVAPSLFGPYEPLNQNGLVLCNPPSEARQAYAWQVIPETLEVVSFIDFWGLDGRDIENDPALKAAQFGGTIAPFARIALGGNQSRIVEGGA